MMISSSSQSTEETDASNTKLDDDDVDKVTDTDADTTSTAKGGYDESIVISKSSVNVYDVALQSSTTVIDYGTRTGAGSGSGAGTGSGSGSHQNSNPVDSLLLAIVKKFNLASLTISISSHSTSTSSSSRQTQSSTQHNHSHSLSHSHYSKERHFPVGTAVQFSFLNNSDSGTDTDTDATTGELMHTLEMEHKLLRILSSRNLLCQHLQLQLQDDFFINHRNNQAKTRAIQQSNANGSKIIMFPNEAYSLCHSATLTQKILASAPCRDFMGVYSQVQVLESRMWNAVDILDRSTWVSVSVTNSISDDDDDDDDDGDEDVQKMTTTTLIDRGLRFRRIVNRKKGGVSLQRLLLGNGNKAIEEQRTSSSGEENKGEGEEETATTEKEPPPQQQHCPLAKSSRIITRDANGIEELVHDLKDSAMDMTQEIIVGVRSQGQGENDYDEEDHDKKGISFGIEKSLLRVDGMANRGTLQTRIYYRGDGSDNACTDTDNKSDTGDTSMTCLDDRVSVSIVDTYPQVISPIYHTMRISLVEGLRTGDEFYSVNPLLSSDDKDYNITHFTPEELDFNLTSGSLTLSQTLPKDSSLFIQLDFRPKFIEFERFSESPNRGFDIPPSIATFSYLTGGDGGAPNGIYSGILAMSSTTTYSNALLIMPPVPDLSMPFNVISIVSTFFALIVGSIMNITIRKSREKVSEQLNGKVHNKKKSLKDKLKYMVRSKVDRMATLVRVGKIKGVLSKSDGAKEKSQ